MGLKGEILELLRLRGLVPSRAARLALDDLLAVIAEEHPDREDEEDDEEEDGDSDDDAGLAVRTIACPHCGEPVVVELELDGGDQEAIHDCSVCCRPIRLQWTERDGRLDSFSSGPG